MGRITSRVVPGQVVDSSTTSWPGLRRAAIERVVASMKEMSGSRWRVSGVGTQMRMASGSSSREKSAVATKRPSRAAAWIASVGMCWATLSPLFSASTRGALMSKPSTRKPAFAAASARGSPT